MSDPYTDTLRHEIEEINNRVVWLERHEEQLRRRVVALETPFDPYLLTQIVPFIPPAVREFVAEFKEIDSLRWDGGKLHRLLLAAQSAIEEHDKAGTDSESTEMPQGGAPSPVPAPSAAISDENLSVALRYAWATDSRYSGNDITTTWAETPSWVRVARRARELLTPQPVSVERVARAILHSEGFEPVPWEALDPVSRTSLRGKARAAILACGLSPLEDAT